MSMTLDPRPHRPKGLPAVAVPSVVCLYLLNTGAPALTLMLSGYLDGANHDNALGNFYWLVGGSAAVFLTVIFGTYNGHLWGVRAYRMLASIMIGLVIVNLVLAPLLAVGILGDGSFHVRNVGTFCTIVAVLSLIPAVIMVRNIRRVRWLDPNARPDEWEPPVARPMRR